jgi:arginyl-tRNA synthetase
MISESSESLELDSLVRLGEALRETARRMLGAEPPAVAFEVPRNPAFGDFSTNLALQLAKTARRPPQALAQDLIAETFAREPALLGLAGASAAGGFINLRLAPACWQGAIARILREGAAYGRGRPTGRHVSLEYGSANPTGPLVVVQGRTLSLGSALAAALRFIGDEVTTEWIINDAGSQIGQLRRSLYARYRQLWEPDFPFPEDGYPGDYLLPLAEALRARDGERWRTAGEAEWAPCFGTFGRDAIVAHQQAVADRFRARNDLWQSERALHDDGSVEAGIARLRALDLIYEQGGALWVRTTAHGDDEDRVVVRADGRPTYYAGDVAYHYEKFQRGADAVIDILGPDHHGYISRLNTLAAAYGHPGAIEVLTTGQMTLKRGDEIVSMSKRAGHIVTLEEILDEVGVDAARFFFLIPSAESPMTFDLELAKEQSSENPVYYVQYGHARIASIERKASPELRLRALRGEGLERLVAPAELALARRLAEFPAKVRSVAEGRAPQRLARYAQDIAADFHQFYMACTVLGDDEELSSARLGLVHATKLVLAQTLGILGVSAPEQMERNEREA